MESLKEIIELCTKFGWWNLLKISLGIGFVVYAFCDMKSTYKRMQDKQLEQEKTEKKFNL